MVFYCVSGNLDAMIRLFVICLLTRHGIGNPSESSESVQQFKNLRVLNDLAPLVKGIQVSAVPSTNPSNVELPEISNRRSFNADPYLLEDHQPAPEDLESEEMRVAGMDSEDVEVARKHDFEEGDKRFLRWLRKMFKLTSSDDASELEPQTTQTTTTKLQPEDERRMMKWFNNLIGRRESNSRNTKSDNETVDGSKTYKEVERKQDCNELKVVLNKLNDKIDKLLEQNRKKDNSDAFLLVKIPRKLDSNDVNRLNGISLMENVGEDRNKRYKRALNTAKDDDVADVAENEKKSQKSVNGTDKNVVNNDQDTNLENVSLKSDSNTDKPHLKTFTVKNVKNINPDDASNVRNVSHNNLLVENKENNVKSAVDDVSDEEVADIFPSQVSDSNSVPKNRRRFNNEYKATETVKTQLLTYIEHDYQELKNKMASLAKVKNSYGEDRSFKIGYIVANLDILEMNLDKLRKDMDVNSSIWSEAEVLNLFEKVNTSGHVVDKLLNSLESYSKPVAMGDMIDDAVGFDSLVYKQLIK